MRVLTVVGVGGIDGLDTAAETAAIVTCACTCGVATEAGNFTDDFSADDTVVGVLATIADRSWLTTDDTALGEAVTAVFDLCDEFLRTVKGFVSDVSVAEPAHRGFGQLEPVEPVGLVAELVELAVIALPVVSAWAKPDQLASAAPSPRVTAPAPSQLDVSTRRRAAWRARRCALFRCALHFALYVRVCIPAMAAVL